jgi:hypothetical protein
MAGGGGRRAWLVSDGWRLDDDADVRSRTVYLVQIGYISMQVRESMAVRMSSVKRCVEIYSGRSPSESEMARFHARSRFKPAASAGHS